ncbi:CD59 glycoprotein-like [Pholidichthys leucotaenia]
MKNILGLILLLGFGMIHVGSGLSCYECNDSTGQCENVKECTVEDACISLKATDGRTFHDCIRYTECDISRLPSKYPNVKQFTFRCCTSNLCNSGNAIRLATPTLALLGSLLAVWWCWT